MYNKTLHNNRTISKSLCCTLDINECDVKNGGCSHMCVNEPGSFSCRCSSGYELHTDKKTCIGNVKKAPPTIYSKFIAKYDTFFLFCPWAGRN